jgi:formylglycine-generating enzyme required for sulfatase activity
MVRIPGGTFKMGGANPTTANWKEQPVHDVTLPAFYMDTTEVTQADYLALMGVNPAQYLGNTKQPVERVTWYDAVLYCNARSKRDGLDTVYAYDKDSVVIEPRFDLVILTCTFLGGLTTNFEKSGYRLPTEAEFEYAYRAGDTTDYYWGGWYPLSNATDSAKMNENSVWTYNCRVNGVASTAVVASKKPNKFGLYDMAGNVIEWCNDFWNEGIAYTAEAQYDPKGMDAVNAVGKIMRGGSIEGTYSYGDPQWYQRASCRELDEPHDVSNHIHGFRCVKR